MKQNQLSHFFDSLVTQLFGGWFLAIHAFEVLILPSLIVPTQILSQYSLTDRFVQVWSTSADTLYYMTIAQSGYSSTSPVFFPLWPLVIRAVGAHPLTAKFVACGCTFLFLSVFIRLIRHWGYAKSGREILLSFIAFPFSFFLLTPMSEPLYLLLLALLFWNVEKRQWKKAALFAALASATRMIGIVASIYFVLALFSAGRKEVKKWWYTMIISPLGLVFYGIYLHLTKGSFLMFYTDETKWERSLGMNSLTRLITASVEIIKHTVGPFKPHPIDLLHFGAVLFFMVLLIFSLKKVSKSMVLYCCLSIFIPMASGTFLGVPRYLLSVFPLFMPFGSWLATHKIWYFAFLALGFMLQSYLLIRFFNYEMVA